MTLVNFIPVPSVQEFEWMVLHASSEEKTERKSTLFRKHTIKNFKLVEKH